jgi:hypothetical protein
VYLPVQLTPLTTLYDNVACGAAAAVRKIERGGVASRRAAAPLTGVSFKELLPKYYRLARGSKSVYQYIYVDGSLLAWKENRGGGAFLRFNFGIVSQRIVRLRHSYSTVFPFIQ